MFLDTGVTITEGESYLMDNFGLSTTDTDTALLWLLI